MLKRSKYRPIKSDTRQIKQNKVENNSHVLEKIGYTLFRRQNNA